MFDKTKFESILNSSWLGHSFLFLDTSESTNNYAKALEKPLPGTLILSDSQTEGKGQYGRKWQSKPGKNLTFSVVLTPKADDALMLLTLACASAVEDIFDEACNSNFFSLKWPNDIYFENKKIGGVLTETIYNGSKLDRIVIGIGLNINQNSFGKELSETAISLREVSGKEYHREELLSFILARLEYNYQRWLTDKTGLVKEVNAKLQGYGKWVSLSVDNIPLPQKMKFLGMNEKGALQVLNKDLEVNTFAYEQVRVIPD